MKSQAFQAAIESVLPSPALSQTHGATVRAQHDDGTIDVECDSQIIGTVNDVPIRCGIPGARVLVGDGQRVQIAFDGGLRTSPYATGFDQDVTAARGVAREGDSVDCGTILVTSVSGGLSLTYIPGGGGIPTILAIAGLISATDTEISLRGVIDSSSGAVKLL